jgi:anti-sigma B factor antagonist
MRVWRRPLGGTEEGSGMKSALFHKRTEDSRVKETRLEAREITVQVVPASEPLTVAVAGRTTVDSSPQLRSVLLGLLLRGTAPVVVIDVAALSYLDMSGVATLLEALEAASERRVKLRLTGVSGQVRTLAELVQLDTIFRAGGSEVEFR